jgi:hypothetical protein
LVDKPTIDFLDDFEGIHQGFYSKVLIQVSDKKNGDTHDAIVYVLDNFKDDLIKDDSKFLESYSNDPYRPYDYTHDTPENTINLINEVK